MRAAAAVDAGHADADGVVGPEDSAGCLGAGQCDRGDAGAAPTACWRKRRRVGRDMIAPLFVGMVNVHGHAGRGTGANRSPLPPGEG